ncbi:hypothetical protein [Roseovarius aestuariivivens]|uniref:hypothetical protein n=1 Tax=Roseovarius aestuariivivens TaxID=1888910 RepID=UPI0010814C32|nr:hypothetical protein [Roseovarius aestuariivivens]
MFARLARQYRRFLLGSVLLTLIMGVAVLNGLVDPGALDPPPATPLIGVLAWLILLVLLIGTPILVFGLFLPGLLPLGEIWLLALLGLTLIDPLIRGAMTALGLPGWAYCLVLFTAFLVTERSLYGPWFARLGRRDMRPRSKTLILPGTPETLWPALVPDPSHAGRYYWPGASFLAPNDDSGADMILCLPRRMGAKDTLYEIHVDACRAQRDIRYRALPRPGTQDPAQAVSITLTPVTDTETRVTFTRQLLDVPAGQRLFLWLTHDFRDSCASLRARLSGRPDRSLQGAQMLRT